MQGHHEVARNLRAFWRKSREMEKLSLKSIFDMHARSIVKLFLLLHVMLRICVHTQFKKSPLENVLRIPPLKKGGKLRKHPHKNTRKEQVNISRHD